MARPAAAAMAAVYIPSDTWPGYESDSNDDDNDDDDDKEALAPWKSYFGDEPPWTKCFDENFKTGARNDCWKGATAATNRAVCNVTLLLPPTAPEYDSPYFRLPVSSESMLTSDGEKKRP